MNWKYLRHAACLETRASFVNKLPRGGNLLDIGSSDGRTLNHFAELRGDLNLFASDIAGDPEHYPPSTKFFRGDIQRDRLPWPDSSLDGITCMQLVEHLTSHQNLCVEISRLLKPGARVFFETPHPKTLVLSSAPGRAAGTFTMNFYDDLSHTRIVSMGALAQIARQAGLEAVRTGISRNWILAALYPFFFFAPACRKKFITYGYFIGWSAYLICEKPISRKC